MGRPCDCFCGGTSDAGGGGDIGGGDDSGGGGIVPPVPIIPSADRLNVGPYKVYLGSRALVNLPSVSGSVVDHLDEFIMSFHTPPTVEAFSSRIMLIHAGGQKVIATRSASPNEATIDGKTVMTGHGWNVYDYASVCASGFADSSNTDLASNPLHLGVGDNFIQLNGGRISTAGGRVFCHDDDWKNVGCSSWRCVDGRTFGTSGISQTDNDGAGVFVSMGSNAFGAIGRAGICSGTMGNCSTNWQPAPIEDCVDNQGYPYRSLFIGDKCGMILSYFLETEGGYRPQLDADPDTYMCMFGIPVNIGKLHTCYDPEISTPPFGITPPEVIAYQDCVPDGWHTQAFYGSDVIGRMSNGQIAGTFAFKEVVEAYPGFFAVTNHEQPAEAFPAHDDDLCISTSYGNWPQVNQTSMIRDLGGCTGFEEGEPGCNVSRPVGKISFDEIAFSQHLGYRPPAWVGPYNNIVWDGENTNSCVALNLANGWRMLPHRKLNGNTKGKEGSTSASAGYAGNFFNNTDIYTGRGINDAWNIDFTHSEYQFSTSKFVPTYDLVNGIPQGGGIGLATNSDDFQSSGDYIFVGGAKLGAGGSGTTQSYLQKYPPEIFTKVGIRETKDPEASGSHIVAFANRHNTSSPPAATGNCLVNGEDQGWYIWSGVSDTSYLTSAFLPSGLESASVIPYDFELTYTVYYSGEAITTFGSGWHYRS